jgi:hypothetical protein
MARSMAHRGWRRVGTAAVVMLLAATCTASPASPGTPAASPTPSPTASPSAIGNFPEFAATFCEAVRVMIRGFGNPDTGEDSELSVALDAAIEQGDGAAAERIAAQIDGELEAAGRLALAAEGWPPGTRAAVALGRMLNALRATVQAKYAAGDQGLGAAEQRAQQAFRQAGGKEAWTEMLTAAGEIQELGRADAPACP